MYAIKRKERVVVAVRRIARERLDKALMGLVEPNGEARSVAREVGRVLLLLRVVGKAMDAEALQRERTALRRVRRRLNGLPAEAWLSEREGIHQALRDVRMRAGYWHLEGEGFAVLRPGLCAVYGAARRSVRRANDQGLVDDAAREKLRAACLAWADALRLVERSWPAVWSAERARVKALAEFLDSADVPVSELQSALAEASAWMGETPGRWADRCAGCWSAWRGDVADG